MFSCQKLSFKNLFNLCYIFYSKWSCTISPNISWYHWLFSLHSWQDLSVTGLLLYLSGSTFGQNEWAIPLLKEFREVWFCTGSIGSPEVVHTTSNILLHLFRTLFSVLHWIYLIRKKAQSWARGRVQQWYGWSCTIPQYGKGVHTYILLLCCCQRMLMPNVNQKRK